MTKRAFDVIVATILLILTAPLIGVSALAIKLTSQGPLFYRARRAGMHGTLFQMLKLRTMRTGLDSVDRRVTEENDNRITRVGAILRKCKLDELPQLWNVLLGDMSIVGPRPEDWEIVQNHYTERQRRTLSVRPGIASYAEVRWYPDLIYHDPPPPDVAMQTWYVERHMPAELEESLRYVEEQSLWLDIKIMFQIARNVLLYSVTQPKKLAVFDDSSIETGRVTLVGASPQ